jgi:hypothetical protein
MSLSRSLGSSLGTFRYQANRSRKSSSEIWASEPDRGQEHVAWTATEGLTRRDMVMENLHRRMAYPSAHAFNFPKSISADADN